MLLNSSDELYMSRIFVVKRLVVPAKILHERKRRCVRNGNSYILQQHVMPDSIILASHIFSNQIHLSKSKSEILKLLTGALDDE